eukprot:1421147-Pleurochrysis_carterae.AAC.1
MKLIVKGEYCCGGFLAGVNSKISHTGGTQTKVMSCNTTCHKKDTCNTKWHRAATNRGGGAV